MATPQQKAFCICSVFSTPFAVEFVILYPDTERLLLWSRHFATWSLVAAAAARNTFLRQLQTNF
jgi:hypothetical protein